ncbi:MAG: hypothetical protein ACXABK_06625 [Candidatus Heimdallarchaeaceae archaeon]|jgi:hypothetical protein
MTNSSNVIEDLRSFFPSEALSDIILKPMPPKKLFWRPNNYRRRIIVKQRTEDTLKTIKTNLYKANVNRQNKILSVKNYQPNITIMLGKDKLTAIYSQNKIGSHKEIFLIERSTFKEIEQVIDKKKNNIQKRLDKALIHFSRRFKLNIPLSKPIWTHHEDFAKGEDFMDKIDREAIVFDTFFKKPYKEKHLEFLGKEPAVYLKNYVKNRCIEDISPLLAQEIRSFNYNTSKLLAEFSTNIKLHLKV